MRETEITDEQIAARIAAADQEAAEWGTKADKLAVFYTHLRDAGMSKGLAGCLTIAEHSHQNEMEDEESPE